MVPSDTRGSRFESSHWQKLYWTLVSWPLYWKHKNKEKRGRELPILDKTKKAFPRNGRMIKNMTEKFCHQTPCKQKFQLIIDFSVLLLLLLCLLLSSLLLTSVTRLGEISPLWQNNIFGYFLWVHLVDWQNSKHTLLFYNFGQISWLSMAKYRINNTAIWSHCFYVEDQLSSFDLVISYFDSSTYNLPSEINQHGVPRYFYIGRLLIALTVCHR